MYRVMNYERAINRKIARKKFKKYSIKVKKVLKLKKYSIVYWYGFFTHCNKKHYSFEELYVLHLIKLSFVCSAVTLNGRVIT